MWKSMYVLSMTLFSFSIKATDLASAEQSKAQFKCFASTIIQQAKDLANAHKHNKNMPIPVVAIAGCSAVGKSNFTHKLAKLLREDGVRVAIFQQDDFNSPQRVINQDSKLHPQFDCRRVHAVMPRVISGEEHVEKPVYESVTKWQPIKEEVTACFHNIDLILFDGIYTLCDAQTYDLLKYSTLRIFLYAREETIVAWNWSREQKVTKPRSKEKFDADIAWDMEDYRTVVLPSKKYADFVICKDEQHNFIELIVQNR